MEDRRTTREDRERLADNFVNMLDRLENLSQRFEALSEKQEEHAIDDRERFENIIEKLGELKLQLSLKIATDQATSSLKKDGELSRKDNVKLWMGVFISMTSAAISAAVHLLK